MGNSYYNCQYFKSEQQCLLALNIRQTSKLYEYLAWVDGYIFGINEKGLEYSRKCLELNHRNIGANYFKIVCSEEGVVEKLKDLSREFP